MSFPGIRRLVIFQNRREPLNKVTVTVSRVNERNMGVRQKEIPGKKKDHDEKVGIPFRKVAEIHLDIGSLPTSRNDIRCIFVT